MSELMNTYHLFSRPYMVNTPTGQIPKPSNFMKFNKSPYTIYYDRFNEDKLYVQTSPESSPFRIYGLRSAHSGVDDVMKMHVSFRYDLFDNKNFQLGFLLYYADGSALMMTNVREGHQWEYGRLEKMTPSVRREREHEMSTFID